MFQCWFLCLFAFERIAKTAITKWPKTTFDRFVGRKLIIKVDRKRVQKNLKQIHNKAMQYQDFCKDCITLPSSHIFKTADTCRACICIHAFCLSVILYFVFAFFLAELQQKHILLS